MVILVGRREKRSWSFPSITYTGSIMASTILMEDKEPSSFSFLSLTLGGNTKILTIKHRGGGGAMSLLGQLKGCHNNRENIAAPHSLIHF